METGNIASWNVKVGDEVEEADVVCEIETDKAVVGFESMDEGFVAKIIHGDGAQNIKVGEPVFILVEDPKDVAAFADFTVQAANAPVVAPVAAPVAVSVAVPVAAPVAVSGAPVAVSAKSSGDRVKVSPLGKKMLADNQADAGMMAGNVSPTGPDGRFREVDVQKFIQKLKSGELQPAAVAPVAAAPTSSATQSPASQQAPASTPAPTTISAVKPASEWALLSKQTIPHYYSAFINCGPTTSIWSFLRFLEQKLKILDKIIDFSKLSCKTSRKGNLKKSPAKNCERTLLNSRNQLGRNR